MTFSQMDASDKKSLAIRIKTLRKVFLRLVFLLLRKKPSLDTTVLYFVCENQTWVLSRILNEIKANYGLQSRIISPQDIGKHLSGFYFFDHYLTYMRARTRNLIPDRSSFIWFTHPRESEYTEAELVEALSDTLHIYCQSSIFANDMRDAGLNAITVLPGGVADSFINKAGMYKIQDKQRPLFIISSRFYPRKNPSIYQSLIKSRNDIDFLFIGEGWKNKVEGDNVIYKSDLSYMEYPALYHQANCLLSLSLVEGGPLCLLEAAACGLPVIATETGIVHDLSAYTGIRVLHDSGNLSELLRLCDEFIDYKRFPTPEIQTWDDFGSQIACECEHLVNKEIAKLNL